MLEHLRLRNVGPAPGMELAYRRSVNLLTGDNGLGKTFVMDAAWWVLTGHWPHDVNPRLTVGFPARPGDMEASATIEARVGAAANARAITGEWSQVQERWLRSAAGGESLVVYAHADGSMSVWDPLRNYLGGLENNTPPGLEKRSLRDVDQWAAYVFSESGSGTACGKSLGAAEFLLATACCSTGPVGSRIATGVTPTPCGRRLKPCLPQVATPSAWARLVV